VNKPYSESCDQNRDVILAVIEPILGTCTSLLEIGSGTGQHAIYFSRHLPHIMWQTSDRMSYHDGISAWINESPTDNVLMPLTLDVSESSWPQRNYDAIFSANTLHIMNDTDVENFFSGAGRLLETGSDLLIYGPFNYGGAYTSNSNESFDQWLKARDVESGIKDFETVEQLASLNGLYLQYDYAMPANNRILHFVKS
jgi:hypothetical protein